MERIKALNGFQKGILVLLAGMMLVFTILYPVTTSRVGYAYRGAVLVQSQDGENTVYTGKVDGVSTRFTVTPDKAVELQYGQEHYGPYTIERASSAAPTGPGIPEDIVGIQLLRGDEVIFRGGMVDMGDRYWILNEDGSTQSSGGVDMGIFGDRQGTVISPAEPGVATILELRDGAQLTHKGEWWGWWAGMFCCVVTALSMVFADELFRFELMFHIRNVEDAQPSEWEMFGRYAAWVMLPILALIAFLVGLQ